MTHSQIPQTVRRRGQRGTARARPSEDPQLRRMLTSHIHCGQPMQLVTVNPAPPEERNDGDLLTYSCACGFSFDQRQD
ncbi:hypothetical protein ACOM2C_01970 [Pseudarthrobacter sp. So.54]